MVSTASMVKTMFLLSVIVIAVVLVLVAQIPISEVVRERIEGLFGETTIPETHLVAIAFVIGVGAFHTPIKLVLRYFSTVVHELGHAFMAGALLAKPKSIHIHPSSSGLAIYELSPNWGRFRASLVSAAGYPFQVLLHSQPCMQFKKVLEQHGQYLLHLCLQ